MNEYSGIKVGDIITTYHSGYHKLIEITDRSTSGFKPLFRYRKVVLENGELCKRKLINECDAQFCRKVNNDSVFSTYNKELKAARDKYDNLMSVMNK